MGHEKTLTGLIPALAGANLIYGPGMLESGLTFDFAQLVLDCEFSDLGGNAVFISGHNSNINISRNHIYRCGASAICLVGLPSAVRSPSFNYHDFIPLNEMDDKRGPKTSDYPVNCRIDNNLIHDIGKIEKQTAGVQISMSMKITSSLQLSAA